MSGRRLAKTYCVVVDGLSRTSGSRRVAVEESPNKTGLMRLGKRIARAQFQTGATVELRAGVRDGAIVERQRMTSIVPLRWHADFET